MLINKARTIISTTTSSGSHPSGTAIPILIAAAALFVIVILLWRCGSGTGSPPPEYGPVRGMHNGSKPAGAKACIRL